MKDLNRTEKLGRYLYQHPAAAIVCIFGAIIVLAGALAFTFFRGESTRDTATEIQRIVTHSACKEDPRGEECQAILTASIKAFDRHTVGILARKLERYVDQDRRDRESNAGPRKDGADETTDPEQRSAGGPAPAPSPDTSDPGTGSSGGDGAGSPSGGPDDPPPTDPPTTPTPPDDPPASTPPQDGPSVGGSVGGLVDGVTGTVCGATTQLGLPVCIR